MVNFVDIISLVRSVGHFTCFLELYLTFHRTRGIQRSRALSRGLVSIIQNILLLSLSLSLSHKNIVEIFADIWRTAPARPGDSISLLRRMRKKVRRKVRSL